MEMPKTIFATTFLLTRRAETGQRVVDPRALAQALALFDRINQQIAKKVLKAWQRNQDYQDAIEQVADTSRTGPGSPDR